MWKTPKYQHFLGILHTQERGGTFFFWFSAVLKFWLSDDLPWIWLLVVFLAFSKLIWVIAHECFHPNPSQFISPTAIRIYVTHVAEKTSWNLIFDTKSINAKLMYTSSQKNSDSRVYEKIGNTRDMVGVVRAVKRYITFMPFISVLMLNTIKEKPTYAQRYRLFIKLVSF
jgi:hypothetical protein